MLMMGAVCAVLGCGGAHADERNVFKPLSKATQQERSKNYKPLPAAPVDLNNATREELEALPGIGPVESRRIIDARPFGSKAWLVTLGIIPQAAFERLKSVVVVGQPKAEDLAKNPIQAK
jgi:DNA uptake protein ComE-like DNA-binding protein